MGLPFSTWYLVAGLGGVCLVFGCMSALLNRQYVFRDGIINGVVGQMGSGKSLFMVQRVIIPFCRSLAKKGTVTSSTGRPVRRIICNFRIDPVEAGFVRKNGEPIEVVLVQPTEDEPIFAVVRRLAAEIGALEGPWTHPVTGRLIQPTWSNEIPAGYEDVLAGVEREPILNGLVALDEMHLFTPSEKMSMDADARYVTSMARKLNAELWWVSQHEMKVHKRLRDDSEMIWRAGKLQGPLTALVGSGWFAAQAFHTMDVRRPTAKAIDRRIYRYTKRVGRVYDSFALLLPDPVRRPGGRPLRLVEGPPARVVGAVEMKDPGSSPGVSRKGVVPPNVQATATRQ